MGVGVESKFHVLAVDDSLIERKIIERLLKISSFRVTTVESGSKALEYLGLHVDDQTHAYSSSSPTNYQEVEVEVNLIITDYCMPGMTGYDLLKKIKESSSLRNIPVVIMSSENVPSRVNRCLEEGAEEFFLKPVQLSDLRKLRTRMMKSKVKHRDQEKQKEPQKLEIHQQLQKQQEKSQQQQQQQQQQQPTNVNKRKALEEGLSPDKTRPRYNGITTVV